MNNAPKKNATILYVDTDKVLVEQYTSYFTSKGYSFHHIRDPRAIPQNLKMHKPDLLLMEVSFDHINGDDVIRGLRKKGLKIPIVVLSRVVSKKLLIDMKQFQVNGFYVKPVTPEVLEARLMTVIAAASKTGKAGSLRPAVLVLAGNPSVNSESLEVLPLSLVNEYDFTTVFAYSTREAIDAIKQTGGAIKLVMAECNDPATVATFLPLMTLLRQKLKLRVYAIAETLPDDLREQLAGAGVDSIIDKSDETSNALLNALQSDLLAIYEQVHQKTSKKRTRIISDLKGVNSLPPLPDIYLKIEALSQNPEATAAEYGNILELDPPITARILRMSNSALYSFKRKINSVKDAVALMGTREILSLVRLACITGNLKTSPEIDTYIRDIWRHCSVIAITAKEVYSSFNIFTEKGIEEDLFISGIIHDIGKIVLAKVFPEVFLSYVRETSADSLWNLGDEKLVMGVNHCEIGMRLAEHWKLPKQFVEVIGYHHDPSWDYQSDYLRAMYLADTVSTCLGGGFLEADHCEIDPGFLEATGLSDDQVLEFAAGHGDDIIQKAEIVTSMITG